MQRTDSRNRESGRSSPDNQLLKGGGKGLRRERHLVVRRLHCYAGVERVYEQLDGNANALRADAVDAHQDLLGCQKRLSCNHGHGSAFVNPHFTL